jgi:hypothetical protein
VRLFPHNAKPRGLVDAVRRGENALRPKRDFPVTRFARELDALGHKPLAQPSSARSRVDVKQPQLCRGSLLRVLDQKNVAHMPSIHLCDPAAFPRRVESLEEICDDACRKRFEGPVPSELLDLARAFQMHHHSHVSWTMVAHRNFRCTRLLFKDNLFHGVESSRKLYALMCRKLLENRGSLLAGAKIQSTNDRASAPRDLQNRGTPVVSCSCAGHQSCLLEFAQNPAKVAGIEAECFSNFLGLKIRTSRQRSFKVPRKRV